MTALIAAGTSGAHETRLITATLVGIVMILVDSGISKIIASWVEGSTIQAGPARCSFPTSTAPVSG